MSEKISNLLQHRLNYFFFILLAVLLILFAGVGPVEGYSFGVSPASVDLNFDYLGQKCVEFEVYGKNSFVNIEDYWSLSESHDISDYSIDGIETIKADYIPGVYVKEREMTLVCFDVLEEGNYYGLIVFSPEKGNAEIGVWVRINYNGPISEIARKDLSGQLEDEEVYGINSNHVAVLTSLLGTLVLEGILFILIFKLERIKREELS